MNDSRIKCYMKCEHDKCKGKEHNTDDYEFCSFCSHLCGKCDKARFQKFTEKFGPRR